MKAASTTILLMLAWLQTAAMSQTFGCCFDAVAQEYDFLSTPGRVYEHYLLLSWGPQTLINTLALGAWIATRHFALRHALRASAWTIAVGCVLRAIPSLFGAAFRTSLFSHALLHSGQLILAVAGAFVMCTPTVFSFEWFGDCARCTFTSCFLAATFLAQLAGAAASLAIGASTVGLRVWVIFQAVLSVLLVCAVSFVRVPAFPEKPPSAAAAQVHAEEFPTNLWKVLEKFGKAAFAAVKNPRHMVLVIGGGLALGAKIAWDVQLPSVLTPFFGTTTTLWMLLTKAGTASLGVIATGIACDRVEALRQRLLLVALVTFSIALFIAGWLAAMLPGPWWITVPLLSGETNTVFLAMALLGFFQSAPFGVLWELSAELTFPVSPAFSSSLFTCFGYLTAIIFFSVFPPALPLFWTNAAHILALSVAMVVCACVRDRYPRLALARASN